MSYAEILTRELNRLRQNGDLISVRDVELAMKVAAAIKAAA